jgi:type IV secretory pathway VirB2 component (pilin)
VDFSVLSDSMRAVAVLLSVLVLAYAGVVLMTSQNPQTRNEWKEIAAGVFIGLSIIFLAPIISSFLGGGTYCR